MFAIYVTIYCIDNLHTPISDLIAVQLSVCMELI